MLTEINIRYGHQYYGHIKCHNVGPYGLMLYMLMKILLHTIFKYSNFNIKFVPKTKQKKTADVTSLHQS